MKPAAVVGTLRAAVHLLLFEELNAVVPESGTRWAFSNARLMRKRFSSGDLLFYTGWFDEAFTDRAFARMHELVEGTREQRG